MKANYRYKLFGVWVTTPMGWQMRKHPNWVRPRPGDCIAFSCLMALIEDDVMMLESCAQLLRDKVRWPRELNPPDWVKYRSQKSMTRDPYITHAAVSFLMKYPGYLKNVREPWWLRRSYFTAWRNYLSKGNEKYKGRFERRLRRLLWWGVRTEGIKERCSASKIKIIRQLRHRFGINVYSMHLWCLMAWCADSTNAKVDLFYLAIASHTWNTLCMVMIRIWDDEILEKRISEYKETIPYPWSSDAGITENYAEGPALAEEMLKYFFNNTPPHTPS